MTCERRAALSAGFLLALTFWTCPAAAEVLRVGGTGGATALLEHLGRLFTQQTGIAVDVVPSLGSGGGINAVADGALDIAISGRPLSAGELSRGLVQFAAIRTPYVLATSLPVAPAMDEHAIIEAFAAQAATWPDGLTIKLILRPRTESDNIVLGSLFAGMPAAIEAARRRSGVPTAATDQDNAAMAERLPRSLIGSTYTQIVMEKRDLRLVTIAGVAPSLATFESGAYRYAKQFRVVHRQPPGAATSHFMSFLRSSDGVRALRAAGCLPGTE